MSGGKGRRGRAAENGVLVVGAYLADREHLAVEISAELGRSRRWSVDQRWVAVGSTPVPPALLEVTAWRSAAPRPKFDVLNQLLREVDRRGHRYLLLCDDDVRLPDGFVDRYLELVERHDLALAQPARTHGSFIDHPFVEQLDGIDARLTRFVEIGPLVSIRRDAVRHLVPFDPRSPMGWGLDFSWPVTMERAGLRMGIVDAVPVAHDLRPPAAHYDRAQAASAMRAHAERTPHLTRDEAFTILEAWS